jgi:hypothetical protein
MCNHLRIKVSQPTLKCAAWNIKRGFVIREAELKHLIESECLDIISISETDLYYQTEPPRIEGFKSIPTKRSSLKQKVRLMTLVKNSLANAITVRLDLMSEDFPSVWIEIQGLLAGSVYKEWGKLQDVKLEILLGPIQAASSSKKNVIVMGDFNFDQLKWDNSVFQLTRVSECQVLQAINKLKSKPSSGLDQINSNVLKAGVGSSPSVDHQHLNHQWPLPKEVEGG